MPVHVRVASRWRQSSAPLSALPWYIAMGVEHGTAYLQSFFVGDNLERFATDRSMSRARSGFTCRLWSAA